MGVPMKLLIQGRNTVMRVGATGNVSSPEPLMRQGRAGSLPMPWHRQCRIMHLHCLLSLLALAVPAFAQPATPKSIHVVMDNNYPPFAFNNNEGKMQGILVDEWHLWEAETG